MTDKAMTWDEMVETAARAMWLCGNYTPWPDVCRETPKVAEDTRCDIRAALTALRDAGVRFMPEVATKEMLIAHYTARNNRDAYTAMRDAGEIKPEDGK